MTRDGRPLRRPRAHQRAPGPLLAVHRRCPVDVAGHLRDAAALPSRRRGGRGLAADRLHRGLGRLDGGRLPARTGQAGHRPGLRPGALHQPAGSQRCQRDGRGLLGPVHRARAGRGRAGGPGGRARAGRLPGRGPRAGRRPGHHDHVRLLRPEPVAAQAPAGAGRRDPGAGRRLPLRRLLAGRLRDLGGAGRLRARPHGRLLVGAALLRLPEHLPLRGGARRAGEVHHRRGGPGSASTSTGSSTTTWPA